MKFDDITTLRCFRLIYDNKSITKTSALMGLSKAAVSKRLDAFELEIGIKLFSRTTRSIVPTNQSKQIIDQVRDILASIDSLSLGVREYKKQGVQRIRVTCISTMAQRFLGKILYSYQKQNPLVEIDLIVTDSVLDPIEHNIDIVIRVNPSKNSDLVGRKVGPYQLVAVCAPELLNRKAKLKTQDDLLAFPLLFIDQHAHAFRAGSKSFRSKIEGSRKFKTNDSSLITDILLEKKSIGIRSLWDVRELISQKKLKFALPQDYFKKSGDVWILSSAERLENEKIRALYDFILKEMQPYLQ